MDAILSWFRFRSNVDGPERIWKVKVLDLDALAIRPRAISDDSLVNHQIYAPLWQVIIYMGVGI
jgi:hypothetical protein